MRLVGMRRRKSRNLGTKRNPRAPDCGRETQDRVRIVSEDLGARPLDGDHGPVTPPLHGFEVRVLPLVPSTASELDFTAGVIGENTDPARDPTRVLWSGFCS
jgi:hypothetical protein